MVEGKKRVERIPTEWVEEIRPLVLEGRAQYYHRYVVAVLIGSFTTPTS